MEEGQQLEEARQLTTSDITAINDVTFFESHICSSREPGIGVCISQLTSLVATPSLQPYTYIGWRYARVTYVYISIIASC